VLNIRAPVSTEAKEGPYGDEKADEKEPEKDRGSAEMHSAVDDDGPIITLDPDLDLASLTKAFRFAAWSSVVLVCDLFPRA